MQIHWLTVKDIVEETAEVKTFHLNRPKDFTWEEGAFTHIALKGFNEGEKRNRNLVRHMSINNVPNEDTVGFTTRIKDFCSEYKTNLKSLKIGDEVALFKTHSNVPLRRENKNIYLLSAGVGLATFRPLVLNYFERRDQIKHLYSLNIDSTKDYLFTDIFKSNAKQNFSAEFVDNRKDYYAQVEKLANDKDGIFYIVGSDKFLIHNIGLLREKGIDSEQVMIDKRKNIREEFFATASVK